MARILSILWLSNINKPSSHRVQTYKLTCPHKWWINEASLTHWPLGDLNEILDTVKSLISDTLEGNKIVDYSDVTPGFNGLAKGNCMMRRESFKFWFWVRLRFYGKVIFNLILVTESWGVSCAIVFRWMSLDFTDDKSTLVQVMAWCRQAAITWANVDPDLCHHMVSQGHNELTHWPLGDLNEI